MTIINGLYLKKHATIVCENDRLILLILRDVKNRKQHYSCVKFGNKYIHPLRLNISEVESYRQRIESLNKKYGT